MVIPFPATKMKETGFASKGKITKDGIVKKTLRFQPMALSGLRGNVLLIQKKMITVMHLLDVHQIKPLYQFGGQQKG